MAASKLVATIRHWWRRHYETLLANGSPHGECCGGFATAMGPGGGADRGPSAVSLVNARKLLRALGRAPSGGASGKVSTSGSHRLV